MCTSRDQALRKLCDAPYQIIVSGAHLAEMDDFFLLKHAKALGRFVPFVVTASAIEKQSASRVLAQGAFDLIPTPLKHEETISTIRLALWHSKLKALFAAREKALGTYREHMAAFPGDRRVDEAFQKALSVVQKTVSSVERSFQRIDESIVSLSDFATNLEYQTKKRAFERLDTLGK